MEKVDETRAQQLDYLHDPPPAYEDISRPPSSYLDTSSTIDAASIYDGASTLDETTTPTSMPERPFPVTFNLYHKKHSWRRTKFYLGEHADNPFYAVVLANLGNDPPLTLYQGFDTASSVYATARTESKWSHNSIIHIPTPSTPGQEVINEQLRRSAQLTTVSFSFRMLLPYQGEKPRPETFEWRMSHGNEVKTLDGHAWGWKLVRMEDGLPTRKGGKRSERDDGETSDGKEVVAVWADNSKWSKDKFGKFRFLGTGATGDLGDDWSVMAVVTVLRIWQMQRYGFRGAGASSSFPTQTESVLSSS